MISKALKTARDVRAFCDGKVIVGVAEPLDGHVRFRFADDSALLVVTAGPVGYFAEPGL